MKTLLDYISIIFSPSYWCMLPPYSKKWDKILNKLMLENNFINVDSRFTATIGGIPIWIANHPYASFRPRDVYIRPKRITIKRAMRKYVDDLLKTELSKIKLKGE